MKNETEVFIFQLVLLSDRFPHFILFTLHRPRSVSNGLLHSAMSLISTSPKIGTVGQRFACHLNRHETKPLHSWPIVLLKELSRRDELGSAIQ